MQQFSFKYKKNFFSLRLIWHFLKVKYLCREITLNAFIDIFLLACPGFYSVLHLLYFRLEWPCPRRPQRPQSFLRPLLSKWTESYRVPNSTFRSQDPRCQKLCEICIPAYFKMTLMAKLPIQTPQASNSYSTGCETTSCLIQGTQVPRFFFFIKLNYVNVSLVSFWIRAGTDI